MANAKGYDVSEFQRGIPADAEFVFIKASEGGYTDQPGYAEKLAEARRRGLVVGHYHVLHAENPVEGEIEHFCRVAGQVPAGELLVLDFEPYGQSVSDADATVAKNRWLAAVRQRYPNNRVGLYTSRDYWFRTDGTSGDFLWIADHVEPGAPRIEAPWLFHQYSDDPLDAEVFHGSSADLRAWVVGGAWVQAGAPRLPGTTIVPPKPAESPTPAPGEAQDAPTPPVVVSHANVVAAARRDPGGAPGATSHPDDVYQVKLALAAEGLLDRASVDGSFDVRTIEAYAALQRRYGYTGQLADGIPGVDSLTRLGRAHAFTVN